MARRPNREGRGRISSIDALPDEASPHITWAVAELAARKRSESDILFELNDRLEVIGCGPISRSAFNRYSVRRASLTRKLRETREISAAVADTLGPEQTDDVTILIVQMIKEAVLSILETGNHDPKSVMEMSRALNAAVSAEKMSGVNKTSRKAEDQKESSAQVATAEIVKRHPELDGETILKSIRAAYGIGAPPMVSPEPGTDAIADAAAGIREEGDQGE